MSIKRNDPCPCGSGKKYKKCCLQQANVIELSEVKERRFFEQRDHLTSKLLHYVYSHVPEHEQRQLYRSFTHQLEGHLDESLLESYFSFWLSTVHRFDNGKRGVEMFVEEEAKRFSPSEQRILNEWGAIKPRLIQYIEPTDGGIIVLDLYSDERFFMPYCETLPENLAPWSVAVMLLEPFKDGYCMHGIALWQAPIQLWQVKEFVDEKVKTNNSDVTTVLSDYFLDIFMLLDGDEQEEMQDELTETTVVYDITDYDDVLTTFLNEQSQLFIDNFDGEVARWSWCGDWYRYEDYASPGAINLAKVNGTITVTPETLTFKTTDESNLASFKTWLATLTHSVEYIDETTQTVESALPQTEEMRYCMAFEDKDTPEHFSLYAQLHMQMHELENEVIAAIGDETVGTYLERGERERVDFWLQAQEHHMYMLMRHNENIDILPDFNYVRRQLGLPKSYFVPFERHTALVAADNPMKGLLDPEEIALYEALGFTPETASSFYSDDVINFYKEKTSGKSQATERKYRTGLETLVIFLGEHLIYEKASWKAMTETKWDDLFTQELYDMYPNLSQNKLEMILSTVKAFAKWLDKKYDTTHYQTITSLLNEYGTAMKNSIKLMESFYPHRRRYYDDIDKYVQEMINGSGDDEHEDDLTGIFKIEKINKNSIVGVDCYFDDQAYTIAINETDLLEIGMVLEATIRQTAKNRYKIVELESVFPR
ncbi:YecA family protein [Desertibacillus haloalkaliphilus]|uniref:YecA family protein n=1 Tax=Desertibacillus haloalkaliphilus TaxID=1328930 RepID=UPI001C25382E|nr:SEC-C domain-containing protein [Desertibacillus haloalkaliphilus]MBU8905992.1 SEC-C domain-containing protein [Desertibacillus haloalkaliphilus]